MFLDDQREMSCPFQDQHLSPSGPRAPSLRTLYLKNRNQWEGERGGENKASKMLMGLGNIVSFWFWQLNVGEALALNCPFLSIPYAPQAFNQQENCACFCCQSWVMIKRRNLIGMSLSWRQQKKVPPPLLKKGSPSGTWLLLSAEETQALKCICVTWVFPLIPVLSEISPRN